mmetsp:Transcript_28025/g.64612  ORF Transcript_28025/g.64612 Transcript_28025/m.64612 type:complete len:116 (+) Transcript_28025:864-1211(+)
MFSLATLTRRVSARIVSPTSSPKILPLRNEQPLVPSPEADAGNATRFMETQAKLGCAQRVLRRQLRRSGLGRSASAVASTLELGTLVGCALTATHLRTRTHDRACSFKACDWYHR